MTTGPQVPAFCGVAGLGAMSPGPDSAVAVLRRLFARPAVRRTLDGLSGAARLGLGARLVPARP